MKRVLALGGGIAALAVAGVWIAIPREGSEPKASLANAPRELPMTSPAELGSFVKANSSSSDKKLQDKVGRARIQLAYAEVKKKNFGAARAVLKTAAKEYKGEGIISADYGGIPDQAKYQAICCLVGAGKKEEARKEFLQFMREEDLSPLVHAAYGRLVRLNDGQPDPEGQKLLQAAVSRQEKRIRFETSICGPKAIQYMLPLLGKPARDYKEIAKLCGTTDIGTTLDGMRKGLSALGVEVFGLEVNRQDVSKLKTPFVLLQADHYLIATSIDDKSMLLFDPRQRSMTRVALPASDDAKYVATVLVNEVPALNADQP